MIGKDKKPSTNNQTNQINQTNINCKINNNNNPQNLSKSKSKKSNHSSIISQNTNNSYFQNLTNQSNSNITSDLFPNTNIKLDDRDSIGMSSKNKSAIKSQYKFISKLVELLDTPDIGDVISWNTDGTVIEIKNQRKFVDQVLPQHFKHNNFSNFVRQLNMYHFKKVKNYVTPGIIAYSNQYFIKGCSNLLSEINRRNQSTFQLNKDLSIFDNENIKDDALANKLNFLFNKLFDLENKVKALTNVNDNLLANNLTFMEDLKDKAYYINMLESLIFYIVNNLLPNNIIINSDNLFQNNNLLIDSTHDFKNIENLVCTCDNNSCTINNNNISNGNVFKEKIKDDYFNTPDSPNSSTANLYNFCRQGSLSGFNSFNLGQLNEFIMSNQNCLSSIPHENKHNVNINNKAEKEKQSNNNLELNEYKKPKDTRENDMEKKMNATSNLNNIVLKLNEEKEKLVQGSESFKKNFCDKCFLQKKIKKASGMGSFYYKHSENNNNNNPSNNVPINNNNNNANIIINNNAEIDKNKFTNSTVLKEDFFKVILNKYKDFNLKTEKAPKQNLVNNKFPQLPSKHVQLKQDLQPNDPSFDQNLDVNINPSNIKQESPSKSSNFKKYNKNSNQIIQNTTNADIVCKPQPIKLKNTKARQASLNPINPGFSLENSSSSNGCNSIYEETSQYNYDEPKASKCNK